VTKRSPQRDRVGVRFAKLGLPLLAHALILAAVLAEFTRACDEDNPWRDRLTQSGAIVGALAMFANLVLYFPRDRWSLRGKQACIALLPAGGLLLLVTFGHCALA
jgi:hypothetical protein